MKGTTSAEPMVNISPCSLAWWYTVHRQKTPRQDHLLVFLFHLLFDVCFTASPLPSELCYTPMKGLPERTPNSAPSSFPPNQQGRPRHLDASKLYMYLTCFVTALFYSLGLSDLLDRFNCLEQRIPAWEKCQDPHDFSLIQSKPLMAIWFRQTNHT